MKTQFPQTGYPEPELGEAQRDYAHPALPEGSLDRRWGRFHARMIFRTPDPDLAPQMLNQSEVASVR